MADKKYTNRAPMHLHKKWCNCSVPTMTQGDEWTCPHKRRWVKVNRRNHHRWIEKKK